MKQILLDASFGFILLCLAGGLAYAALMYYRVKHPWSNTLNRMLFALRALLSVFLFFLLLSPIVKQIETTMEKPVVVILRDNSLSVAEVIDSVSLKALAVKTSGLMDGLSKRDFEPVKFDLQGNDFAGEKYTSPSTNIHEALRKVGNRFEGRRIEGVVLISDGIYNTGLSPLYGDYNFPVYTVGLGDTLQRADLAVKDVLYNKIAYQGNQFLLRAEISATGFRQEQVVVSLVHKGSVIERQSKTVMNDGFIPVEFKPVAAEEGLQRWDVVVERKPGESNLKNNQATVFIEVIKGKKKILLVGGAPHPDVKALRSVIEKNANYELVLHIPPVSEAEPALLQPDAVDLIIFHQVPDVRGRHRELFQWAMTGRTPVLLILGSQTDWNQLGQYNLPLRFEQPPRQFDEVTPVINPNFSLFALSAEAGSTFNAFPPVSVHFGKIQPVAQAMPLLMQKVGSLVTDKPLLVVENSETRKTGMMLGEGLWRWRLHEYSKTENTAVFDEFFGKLIQFLSTADDNRKFRCFPVKQQFSETEAVVFESQLFNDIFEPVYGNTIDLEITDEQGKRAQYSYITSPGNTRYSLSGLKEGVYRYKAATVVNGARNEVRGQFLVTAQQLELLNLTADFDLLRKLAANTGGRFYPVNRFDELQNELTALEARGILRSNERYRPIINMPVIFMLLVLLVGTEWFLRKYFGGY
ncbi:MAG: VWA domain-containing protein [Flammeovirgaceae bacterium]|nr:MAG: VWA domain-containing protein [Flammeovirgaceae bacterium]